MSSNEWNWQDAAADGSIVVESVNAVAVYTNTAGNIVIRQDGGALREEDEVIVVPRDRVRALIKALNAELKKG